VSLALAGIGLGIALGCLLFIHLLHNRGRGLGQRIDLGLDLCLVIALDRFFQIGKRLLDCGLLLLGGLVAGFGQRLAGGMHQLIALVAHGHQLLELAIFLGVGLGITHHLLDLLIRQTGVGLDDDRLLLAGSLVLGRHVEDTVGIDVEADLVLRYAARRRRNVGQIEA